MVSTKSEWNPRTQVLRTELTGPITVDDVTTWRLGLHHEVLQVPNGATFRLLLNQFDFNPVNIEAHKAMRTVVPELLASHGLRPVYIDLFDEKAEMEITTARGVRCVAFANVHHDATKMADYQQRIGKPNQKFFTDVEAAEAWLRVLATETSSLD